MYFQTLITYENLENTVREIHSKTNLLWTTCNLKAFKHKDRWTTLRLDPQIEVHRFKINLTNYDQTLLNIHQTKNIDNKSRTWK